MEGELKVERETAGGEASSNFSPLPLSFTPFFSRGISSPPPNRAGVQERGKGLGEERTRERPGNKVEPRVTLQCNQHEVHLLL